MTTDSNLSNENQRLIKFLVASAFFFFIGTLQGVLQIIQPIRGWLDSIGSPYGGPGHMIDPLAHAHINTVGGVVLLCMAVTYFLFHAITKKPVWSMKLIDHSFWWTALGVSCFYTTLIIFGTWEGLLLLDNNSVEAESVHKIYGPVIGIVSTAMGIGFWVFFTNIFMTAKSHYGKRKNS